MNSTAFPLLANHRSEVDRTQEVELTVGSLSILIGPSGSSRLSDPMKQDQDPSAKETEATTIMEYSEGSSSEVNSPVSPKEAQKEKITEDNEEKENFDIEVQLEDLMICIDDKSIDTWETGLELSENSNSISSFNSKIGKQCQVLAIIRRQLRRIRRKRQSSSKPSKYRKRSKPSRRRANTRVPRK
jgi:hypothetical protein